MQKKHLVLGFLVGFVVVFSLGYGCIKAGSWTCSEGERTGTITKFSRKGMFLKTWEGELNMGGLAEVRNGSVAMIWRFSVVDPEIVEKIQSAQRTGGRWTMKYRQQFMRQSWRGETDYFIVDVVNPNK